MGSVNTERELSKIVHVAVMLIFMFGFQFLPPFAEINALGMRTLGIFIGVLYGWSTLGLVFPSLLGLVMLSLLPGADAVTIFKEGFGNRLTVALFLLFLFGEIITKSGVSKFIADWCVSRKFVQGRPYAILAMFCLASAIIAAFVSNFAAIVLMWGILYSFFKELGIKPGDPYAMVSIIAVTFVATMAGDIFPFMCLSLLVNSLQIQLTGTEVPYVVFTSVQIILTLLASVLYFLLVIFVIKPDVSAVKNFVPDNTNKKMTNQQKFVSFLLILMCILLFMPGVLPKDLFITQLLKALDISGVVAMMIVIYYIVNIRNKDAIQFFALAKDINWNIILMFATIAPLASAVMNPGTGIISSVTTGLNAVVGNMSPFLFTIMIIFIASILTQFCNNVSIVMLALPIMYTFGIQLGANLSVLSILVAFNLNIAFCTPAASGMSAMIFSNEKWVGTKNAYKHGLIIFAIDMIVTVLGYFIANLFL